MKKLLSLVGNPHRKVRTVHIGGTKGKGSTATMLAKMQEARQKAASRKQEVVEVQDFEPELITFGTKVSKNRVWAQANRGPMPVIKTGPAGLPFGPSQYPDPSRPTETDYPTPTEDREGWEKLCPFLGKEVPDEEFPFVRSRSSKARVEYRKKLKDRNGARA